MKKTLLIMSLAWLCVGGLPALAQQASAPTATGETGLFTLIDGWTLPKGEWSLGIYYNNWDRLVAPVPGGVARPLSDNWDYDWNRLSASVGYGLTEEVALDKGYMVNGSFGDYMLPTIMDIPDLEPYVAVEDEYKYSGFGAKGVGEIALISTPLAIANAVSDAIGVRFYSLPLNAEKVYFGLKDAA